jgi:hypothetical protein
MASEHLPQALEKWLRRYQTLATAAMNALIIFVLLNLMALVPLWLQKRRYGSDPVSAKYGSLLDKVYPGMEKTAIRELLRESWSRHYAYQPFTYFKERAFKGRYVNVDSHGFRVSKDQGPWPPNKNRDGVIFLFGGSTIFGYGLPDDQTIASYLQEALTMPGAAKPWRVYNFGQGYYYSTQERILYEKLLASGFLPDIAVFIDGLNEYYRPDDNPEFGNRLQELFDAQEGISNWLPPLIKKLPLTQAVLGSAAAIGSSAKPPAGQKYDDPAMARRIADRYAQHTKMIEALTAAYGVKLLLVWQPVPTHRCDPKADLFSADDQFGPAYAKYGYLVAAEYAREGKFGLDFTWCADIQEGITDPLYVDKVHYSAKLSKLLAGCVAGRLLQNGALEAKPATTGRAAQAAAPHSGRADYQTR